MKCHLFYLLLNDKDPEEFHGLMADTVNESDIIGRYSLYAFTDDSDIANEFILTRDMNKFYHKVVNMDKEEYNIFSGKNIEYLLSFNEYNTKKIDEAGFYRVDVINIVSTQIENDDIHYNMESFVADYISPNISDMTYDCILYNLFIPCIHDLLCNHFFMLELGTNNYPIEGLGDSGYQFDEVEMFIAKYANTLKVGDKD